MESKLNCVLLIDDDDPTNFLNQWILQHSGYVGSVEVTEGGQDALIYLKKSLAGEPDTPFPNLIFLDINMPAMNGWEFLDRYNQLEKPVGFKAVIVMLTTTLFQEDITRANNTAEISAFQSKPLTPEIFQTIVETYF